jgi:hypothetical protein
MRWWIAIFILTALTTAAGPARTADGLDLRVAALEKRLAQVEAAIAAGAAAPSAKTPANAFRAGGVLVELVNCRNMGGDRYFRCTLSARIETAATENAFGLCGQISSLTDAQGQIIALQLGGVAGVRQGDCIIPEISKAKPATFIFEGMFAKPIKGPLQLKITHTRGSNILAGVAAQ